MSAAPETKYTDRDVRETPELVTRALVWLEEYQGEFEYLIDMKMRQASGFELTTPMVRGVLNCMRHDPRVTDLPAPMPAEPGDVVPMRPTRRRKHRTPENYEEDCIKTEPHRAHYWTDELEEGHWCDGVEFPINRIPRYFSARIKVPFAVAKSGGLIHQVAPDGHDLRWRPNHHEWGWYAEPELIVNLVCRFPSVLRNPSLLRTQDVQALLTVGLQHCRHCKCVSDSVGDPSRPS